MCCPASRFMKQLHFAKSSAGVRLGNGGATAEGSGCRRAVGLSLRGRRGLNLQWPQMRLRESPAQGGGICVPAPSPEALGACCGVGMRWWLLTRSLVLRCLLPLGRASGTTVCSLIWLGKGAMLITTPKSASPVKSHGSERASLSAALAPGVAASPRQDGSVLPREETTGMVP